MTKPSDVECLQRLCPPLGRRMRSLRFTARVLTVTWLCCGSVVAQDATKAKAGSAKGEPRTLIAKDGWPIHSTYFKSTLGKDACVVVLLHMKGSNRLVWNSFAQMLNEKKGYAVITVDLRTHGESKSAQAVAVDADATKTRLGGQDTKLTRADYEAMVAGDLETVKGFIYEEHQQQNLNMRKLAIVGAEMSGPLALLYAHLDWLKKPYNDAPTPAASTPKGQDVQALVLLSPDVSLSGLTASQAITYVKTNPNIAVLVCAGADDEAYRKNAEKIFQTLGGSNINKERMYFQQFKSKLRGTDLLGPKLEAEAYMLVFLDKHLREREIPWEDRRSKLERD